ncbi:Rossmann-fold superfamily protein [Perilla frutescens var. hirtella]|uniref:Rossmann-fold superfamily protein n=1 Tax=Perilla frutescens var. hirtella TaxID=608512 RepID=A0AAD4IRI6_PERFH|nr:Rossmann-fold superfamily protein [Perilla frutescens var. hirtella]
MYRLEGKVALITGGVTGIGESTAKLFSKHGAKVVIADVQDQLGHSVIKEIGPENSTYIHCDVTNEDDVRDAVDKAVSTYGKLDIMYNNAGIVDYGKLPINDNEKKVFDRVMAVNVTGVFLGMKHAARVMIPARSGAIISTASVAGHLGGSASHAYTCSKHAVVGLSKNLAIELGQYGIRVNCVSPFVVATDLAKKFLKSDQEVVEKMTQDMGNLKGATLKADDVANAALFLASDEAKYVSGQNLFIDGGFTVFNSAMQVFKRN